MNEQTRPPDRPRVLIVSASVGAGHRAVASAILESLKGCGDELSVDCIDALDFAPRLFRRYYAGGFAAAMSRFPRLCGIGFWLTNRPSGPRRSLMERRRLLVERLCLRRLAAYIKRTQPALVVNTHFLPAPTLGRMIQRLEVPTRQIVIVTDICVHRFWYSRNVDHWFVPSEYSAEPLRRWGIEAGDITVSGIPVHAKWTQPLDRSATLARWKLPADKKIVALTGGTEFVCGPVARIARDLLDACGDVHLVALVGRQDKLARKLSSFPQAGERLTVVGYTDRIHELVEVSSLMVTKAGGITTAECLAKGTPMVLLKPVPGHEAGNAAHLAGRGAAVMAESHKQVAPLVRRLLADDGRLGRISAAARRLYLPATDTIVDFIRRRALRPRR